MTTLLMEVDDAEILRECIAWAKSNEGGFEEADWLDAFESMLARDRALSDKQRAWVKDVHERLDLGTHYENLWSSGKVPRGTISTPVPEVLKRPLPMKPPGRRA